MAFYRNRHGELASTYGMPGANEEEEERDARKAELTRDEGAAQRLAQQQLAKQQADAQKYASDAGFRLYEQKKADTPQWAEMGTGGYKNGGPVIKGEFKHAHPTFTKFGQTADSSLLAKGRK